jgi:hypothetical protein
MMLAGQPCLASPGSLGAGAIAQAAGAKTEVQPVVHALRRSRIHVVALHDHMIGGGEGLTSGCAHIRILDDGLVSRARPFVAVVRRYGLEQEYITPYTPEHNGMIERFFGSLRAECVWLHRFQDRDHAFAAIGRWMETYHEERPHSALGYLTPSEYGKKFAA